MKYAPIDQMDDDLFEENEKGGTLTAKNGHVTLCEGETDFDIEPQLKKTSSEETLKDEDNNNNNNKDRNLDNNNYNSNREKIVIRENNLFPSFPSFPIPTFRQST